MIFTASKPERDRLRKAITNAYHEDEDASVRTLLKETWLPEDSRRRIRNTAAKLVVSVRQHPVNDGVEALMSEYKLSSREGVVLMCLAEALLRIPDAVTIDRLIEDKLTNAQWQRHLGHSDSLFVNASTWAFMLTGRLLSARAEDTHNLRHTLMELLARSSEPLIRHAVLHAMRILGRQFIMGRNIHEALQRSHQPGFSQYRYSFDMLGEAARTQHDADDYYERYQEAITAIGETDRESGQDSPGISIKLSALDPRYEYSQYSRCMQRVLPRVRALTLEARQAGIGLTLDAEEASRLEISLDILEALIQDDSLSDWDGLGLAVQAYQKRAIHVIRWLAVVSRNYQRRLRIRLVKGAYWDTEIKLAQEGGFTDYPVFTRKVSTDVSYLACARILLNNSDVLYPQFATHNAHTVASVLEMVRNNPESRSDFEFQRLYGMGEHLYEEVIDSHGLPCRVYAPCGGHRDLLAYLARRLLENGANTSFVYRIADHSIPIDRIVADPQAAVGSLYKIRAQHIPLPRDLYAGERRNSVGIDLSDENRLASLEKSMHPFASKTWRAAPIINGIMQAQKWDGSVTTVEPADHTKRIGQVVSADSHAIEMALEIADACSNNWQRTPVETRAACLEKTAELIEASHPELMALLVREAGRTLNDAVAEIRESVDFCRYYAARAKQQDKHHQPALTGLGVFACISPWNFPLAIFTGQITAALVTGNTVIAKPAEQTPLIAARTIELLLQAGVPTGALQLLPGDGETVGAAIVSDTRVRGIAFTGGHAAAQAIRRATAGRDVTLIAETGGINAMIMDSSALLEQAVADILRSAFGSAGQRCSSLRVLFVQQDIADATIEMLAGAMAELTIGDPGLLHTDIGPIIDQPARDALLQHCEDMDSQAILIHRCALPNDIDHGTFLAPRAYEIESLDLIEQETFGPVLHVLRYEAGALDALIDTINGLGYGLTFGLHSRIDTTVRHVTERMRIGNIYVNRHMTGSVVGSQPFGGEGLSGTGPKAGGPHYLHRFTRPQSPTSSPQKNMVHHTVADKDLTDQQTTKGPIPSSADTCTTNTRDTKAEIVKTSELDSESERIADTSNAVRGTNNGSEKTQGRERIVIMKRFQKLLGENENNLISLHHTATGIPLQQAKAEFEQSFTLISEYIETAKQLLTNPVILPGPSGEHNELSLNARGLFLCLADSQFTLAGLIKLLVPALVTGNSVVVVSSIKTLPIQQRIIRLLLESGVPVVSMRQISGISQSRLKALINHPVLAGVCVTATQNMINTLDAELATRKGAILPMIATSDDAGIDALAGNDDLVRYTTERVISINTAAAGGNPELYNLDD